MRSEFLGECRTPEQWCQLLRSQNVVMSSRRLRANARRMGQFYRLGRTMLLDPDHLKAILEAEADGTRVQRKTGAGSPEERQ